MIGTDMSERSAGRFLCDAFHVVPRRARATSSRPRWPRSPQREGADVVFPQSSGEVVQLRGRPRRCSRCRCWSPPRAAIAACDDKAADDRAAPSGPASAPATHLARTPEEFRAAAAELGYPERDVCMKPPQAKGSRGFRVLSANVDRR